MESRRLVRRSSCTTLCFPLTTHSHELIQGGFMHEADTLTVSFRMRMAGWCYREKATEARQRQGRHTAREYPSTNTRVPRTNTANQSSKLRFQFPEPVAQSAEP